jgi:hypothetical protein
MSPALFFHDFAPLNSAITDLQIVFDDVHFLER